MDYLFIDGFNLKLTVIENNIRDLDLKKQEGIKFFCDALYYNVETGELIDHTLQGLS